MILVIIMMKIYKNNFINFIKLIYSKYGKYRKHCKLYLNKDEKFGLGIIKLPAFLIFSNF